MADDYCKGIQSCTSVITRGKAGKPQALLNAYINRGNAYLKEGDRDRAIADYDQALEINPKYAGAYFNRGNVYYETGKHDRAIADYSKVLEIQPKSANAYSNRGNAYSAKGDYDRALVDYSKALEIDPTIAMAYNNRGNSYNAKGDYDRAIADFNKALMIDPIYATAYYNRGIAYHAKGNPDRAIADYDKALEINPRYDAAYDNRGYSSFAKGDRERAIADYNKALEINPQNAYAYNYRGIAFYAAGDYDRAVGDESRSISLDETNGAAFIYRSLAYEKQGKREAAFADFKKATWLEIGDGPDRIETTAALDRLRALFNSQPGQQTSSIGGASSPSATTTATHVPTPPAVSDSPVVGSVLEPIQTAERRVALVIGNSHYKDAVLANPLGDADLVSASLARAGFDVTAVKDADYAAFDKALTQFVVKEEGAEIALFYFAGHGFAIAGDDLRPRNYLMSTSADLRSTSDAMLRRDGISIDDVIKRISAPARVTLAFVDACRNDPFWRGAGDRGFERIAVPLPRQIYIGMSTQLGRTALDGVGGKGSPFALAFAEKMTIPGLRIDDAFRALRLRVSEMTNGKQQPEILQDDLNQGAIVLVTSK